VSIFTTVDRNHLARTPRSLTGSVSRSHRNVRPDTTRESDDGDIRLRVKSIHAIYTIVVRRDFIASRTSIPPHRHDGRCEYARPTPKGALTPPTQAFITVGTDPPSGPGAADADAARSGAGSMEPVPDHDGTDGTDGLLPARTVTGTDGAGGARSHQRARTVNADRSWALDISH